MAEKNKVLKLLEEKYKAKKSFYLDDFKKFLRELNKLKDTHHQQIIEAVKQKYSRKIKEELRCGGSFTFDICLSLNRYESDYKERFQDSITIRILSLEKEIQEYINKVRYRINSNYDQIRTSITLKGLDKDITEAVKNFMDFGWTRHWQNWEESSRGNNAGEIERMKHSFKIHVEKIRALVQNKNLIEP